MSRRVPRGGPGPEWPNAPDDWQAHVDPGAQRNGNGAPGQDQQQHQYGQYGQYGQPGRGVPAGYGQQYDNQPTRTFNYQRGGAAYQGNGGQRGYNGDPRGYQNGGAQGNVRRYEEPSGTTTRGTTTSGMACRAGAWWPGTL